MKAETWEFEDGWLSPGGLGGLCGRGVASSCSSPAWDGEGGLATARCRGSFIVQIPALASDGSCGFSTRLAVALAAVCGDLAFFLLGGVLLVAGRGVRCGGSLRRRAVSSFLSSFVCVRLLFL